MRLPKYFCITSPGISRLNPGFWGGSICPSPIRISLQLPSSGLFFTPSQIINFSFLYKIDTLIFIDYVSLMIFNCRFTIFSKTHNGFFIE
jgi:hypothetical protein